MRDVLMLAAALLFCVCGFAWLALAMEPHWRQVRGNVPAGRNVILTLRTMGAVALLVSLVLCLGVDHVSMASLLWVMMLAASALIVAFSLTWQPRVLSWVFPLGPRDSRDRA